MIVKVSHIKYWTLIFFCFFPYLNVLRLPTDTQPNALIFALPILLVNYNRKFPPYYFIGIILAIVALATFLVSNLDFGSVLSLSVYISILTVPLAVFFSLKALNGLSYIYFRRVTLIWGAVGLIQKLFLGTFMSFLLSRSSAEGESRGRGVVSLSPEPTYYGSVMLLFLIVYFLNYSDKKDYKLLFIIFFQLIILSLSSTSILVLLCAMAVYFIIVFVNMPVRKIGKIILYALGSVLMIFPALPFFSGSRIYRLALTVANNPSLLLLDQSISERFNAVYFSIKGLFDNYGVPNGYNYYKKYIILQEADPQNAMFFFNFRELSYERILSGYGMGIFELGVFGLLVPLLIFMAARNLLHIKPVLYAFILFNLLLFTAMSFNNSLILFIIGNMAYLSYKEDERKIELGIKY